MSVRPFTIDLSTGEFWVTESTSHTTHADLLDELIRIEPKELIFFPGAAASISGFSQFSPYSTPDPSRSLLVS